MPIRKTVLANEEVYHIFNRSIARHPIFIKIKELQRAIDLLNFYRFMKPPLRFSHFNRLEIKEKNKFLENLSLKEKLVEIYSFSLMPNHFHLQLKQLEEGGISKFISNFQHAYAKYFNIRNKRDGSLFQSMFKAVRIETDEQLLHVCRYIHLNPLTSYLLRKPTQLENYPWNSFFYYLKKSNASFIEKDQILGLMGGIKNLKKFTYDQIGYQRDLNKIKHQVFE